MREHRTTYIVAASVFVVLLIWALVAYGNNKEDATAQQRAEQLTAALNAAGMRAPSMEMITGVLGDDGGPVCADPSGALSRGQLYAHLSNGAGGPGSRPVIAPDKVVVGQEIVMGVYCPDKLREFTEVVNDLRFS